MSYLGLPPDDLFPEADLTILETHPEPAAYAQLVKDFPEYIHQAIVDWARFKAAEPFDIFSPGDSAFIREWFQQLPELWDAIKVNYGKFEQRNFYLMADGWISQFRKGSANNSLGFGVIVIAGVLIVAAIGGVAAALWAIGYIQKQKNVTRLVDETVAGKIPPDLLKAAVQTETEKAGFVDQVTGLFKTVLVIGLGIVLVKYGGPVLKTLTGKK